MFRVAQLILVGVYVLLPLALLAWAIVQAWRRSRGGPIASFIFTCTVGVVGGAALLLLNAQLMGGHIQRVDAAKTIYLAISAVCALKLIDHALLRGVFRLARIGSAPDGGPAQPHKVRAVAGLFVQRLIMLGITLAYIGALLIVYRPKVVLEGDPASRFKLEFSNADLVADDGVELAGWWLPALRSKTLADRPENWARRTIVLCHGVGSGRQRQLPLAQYFVQRGYNVFVFDFRAHGDSDGMFVSYGDRERLDVLAAVKWVRANHPHESEEIFGVGVNTGAVALLGAAADPHVGQQIGAIALYEPYARFGELSREVAERLLTPPLPWITTHLSVPIASLHAGSNLLGFAPVNDAGKIWPRPVLVVHGQGATFTPAMQSMDVYQQLWQPKEQFWPAENYAANRARLRRAGTYPAVMTELFRIYIGTSEDICDDPGVRAATLEFFERARRMPVI